MYYWGLSIGIAGIPFMVVFAQGVFDQNLPDESAYFSGPILLYFALFVSTSALVALLSALGLPGTSAIVRLLCAALASIVIVSALATGMAAERGLALDLEADRVVDETRATIELASADERLKSVEFRFWNYFAIAATSLAFVSIVASFAAQVAMEAERKPAGSSNPAPS